VYIVSVKRYLENMKLTDYQVLLHGFVNNVLYFPVYKTIMV